MKDFTDYLRSCYSKGFVSHVSEGDEENSILTIRKNGKSFCRTYWFHDDKDSVYFDWLSVSVSARGIGIATFLLNSHIAAAKKFNLNSLLWVKKGTWMHEWYKRKGYSDLKDYEQEENSAWMIIENKLSK